MFKCMVTGDITKPGEKCNKIVVRSREKVYTHKEYDMETRKWFDVVDGEGWEIVEEISASDAGVEMWNGMTEDERKALITAIHRRDI